MIKPTVYRCDKGHEMIVNEEWATMLLRDGKGVQTTYNYCPACFGEWAVAQWPFRNVSEQS